MVLNFKNSALFLSLFIFLLMDFAAGRAFTARQDARMREYERIKEIERAQGRRKSPLYHHDLIPMADIKVAYGPEFYRLRANSLGFRDAHPRQVSLKASRPRVLFIGDSFTEGLGVNFEDTFVGMAAKQWESEGMEVLNAGISSYSPIIYLAKIRHLIETAGLEFHHVVLFLDISDIQDEAENYYFDDHGNVKGKLDQPETETAHQDQSPTGGSVVQSGENSWVRNSVTLRALSALRGFSLKKPEEAPQKPIEKRPWDYKAVLDWRRSLWTVNDQYFKEYGKAGLELAEAHMNELLKLLKARHIRLTLAVYPWPDQIYHHDLQSKQAAFWQDWAQKNQVDFINYFPYFIDERPWADILNEFFIPGDIHWNPKGHRLVADILISQIHLDQKQEEHVSV